MITARFLGIGIYSALACQGGVQLAWIARGDLKSAVPKYSVVEPEQLQFTFPRSHAAQEIVRTGLIARAETSDDDDFEEWPIEDIEDASGNQEPLTLVTCTTVAAQLADALYSSADAAGVPDFAYSAEQTDAQAILDGPVRGALDAAGLTHIQTGTVQPTERFDVDGEYFTARSLIEASRGAMVTPGETRVRRNGTTNYLIDWLTEIGYGTLARIRTRYNLVGSRRVRTGALLTTRAGVRCADDGTDRGFGYAPWLISARNTGADWIELTHPDGGTNRGPARYEGQLGSDGVTDVPDKTMYVGQWGLNFMSAQVLRTEVISDTTTRIYVADASLFTVGNWVEFRTTSGTFASRVGWLDNPDGVLQHGIRHKVVDRPRLSGAVNYCPNGDFSLWSNHANPPDGGYTTFTDGTITPAYIAGDSPLPGGGDSYEVAIGGGAGAGGVRSPSLTPWCDADHAWQGFAAIKITAGSGAFIELVRADSGLGIAGLSTNVLANGGIWQVVTIPFTNGSFATIIAAGGFKIQARGTNGVTFQVTGFGLMPASWNRVDVFTFKACDAWKAAQDHLEDYLAPATYNLTGANLYGIDPARFSAAAYTVGGDVEIDDLELNVTPTRRLLTLIGDYLVPINAQFALGTQPRSIASKLRAQQERVRAVAIAETVVAVAQTLINVGAASTGTSEPDAPIEDAPSSSAQVFLQAGAALKAEWARKITRLPIDQGAGS